MVTSIALAASALLTWPGRSAAHRLRQFTGPPLRPIVTLPNWTQRPGPLIIIGTAATAAFATFGIGVAIATAVGGCTARALWRSHRRLAGQLASAEAMSDAVQGMVAELRSGAHPVVAAESAAKDAREPARAVLTAVSATARLGGDLTTTLHRCATERPTLAPVLQPLVQAWSLAQRHGLPLADVLDAVRADIADRVRFAHRVRARMAGPRASGAVLAVLPLLGIALGEAMGAHPLHVLLFGALGQALFAVGTVLICVGLYWITRLTSGAVL